jgi:hypothetical protein
MTSRTIFTLMMLLWATLASAEAPTATGHAFACAAYLQGKILLISADGKVEWEYAAPGCDDIWVLPSGNLLFTTRNGVQEVTRDKRLVFSYESKSEIYACQRLANGNTFVGECNAGRLLEVDPAGKIVKELRLLPEGTDGGHFFMRNARRLANGNYLVAHYGMAVVREYDPQGKVVMEIPAVGGPHSVVRLPNGHTLVACGNGEPDKTRRPPSLFEADKSGKIVWQLKEDELPGIRLDFVGGLQRLPNGNTLLTNYVGFGQSGTGPHLIEVTPDKKVAWTFRDESIKAILSVQLLDVPGDATKGEILH